MTATSLDLAHPPPLCLCGRAPRGFGWSDPSHIDVKRYPACSLRCLDTLTKHRGTPAMSVATPAPLTEKEGFAIMDASPAIGEYLEKLGKTDMATMTEEEWLDFLAFAHSAICEAKAVRYGDEVPF